MSRSSTSIKTLEHRRNVLQSLNAELKNRVDLKNTAIENSLSSLIQGATSQSSLGSFNNLAYFNIYAPITINWTLLTYMYKTHGLLQTAIDMPVLDAVRGGLEIKSKDLDQDDIKDLQDRIEDGNIISNLTEVGSWTRLYGGGALVVNTDQDPVTPLDMRKVKRLEFYAASRWEVSSPMRHSEFYEFYGKKIHHTRVLTMAGKAAPYLVKGVLPRWGMSEMERMIEDFNMYLRTKDVIYELLKEAKIDVYRFKNFNSQLASAQGTQMTLKRAQLMNQLKAYNNAVVMDAEDEFEQKQITFAGLAEVHKQNQVYIASALRMPCTKLFGLSAAGFNSGEDDIENYNAMVESEVRQPMRPIIKKVLELLCMQVFGDVYDLNFTYKPLRVMSAKEEEEIKTSEYNRYKSMFDDGQMDPQEYGELLHAQDLIPIETSVAKGGELFENPMKQIDGAGEQVDEEEDPIPKKEKS